MTQSDAKARDETEPALGDEMKTSPNYKDD